MAGVVLGWGAAHRPHLIAPDITIAASAAPDNVIELLLGVLGLATLIVIPSLYWLMRLFKSERSAGPNEQSERAQAE